ncbi:MAG: hypothetical protein J07HQX50_00382 [Haloquadratum sp. J07HQX50]|nr:MAG: hypothetical protein J07HQX50_00382 [Haloquadratum sp. J07HQX50]
MISGPLILTNVASTSLATAFAIIVLPVPGGPYKRTPFGGSTPRCANTCGLSSGSSIISRTNSSSSSSPPISSYVTRPASAWSLCSGEGAVCVSPFSSPPCSVVGRSPTGETTCCAVPAESILSVVESVTLTRPSGVVSLTTNASLLKDSK